MGHRLMGDHTGRIERKRVSIALVRKNIMINPDTAPWGWKRQSIEEKAYFHTAPSPMNQPDLSNGRMSSSSLRA
jgi:hypothetical protein